MNSKRSSLFCLLIQALLLTPLSAQAAAYYVATTGNNGNQGSEALPWRTIAYAVGKMNPGDTTYVKSGVYTDHVRFSRSGTASAPIKLMSAPDEKPVIDCGHVGTNMVLIQNGANLRNPMSNITIEGFEIRRCRHGLSMYNGNDIVIRRNWIHDNLKQGILGGGKNTLIDRNIISHNGDFALCAQDPKSCNQMHGIYGNGPNWVITNNIIYDNLSYGITVAGYQYCPPGATDPLCSYNGRKIINSQTDASYAGANNWLIANNTIAYQNYSGAIALWWPLTTNSKIMNNIFYENTRQFSSGLHGITFSSSPGKGHLIANNICYAGRGRADCIAANGAGKYTGTGNITVRPNFVNAGPTIPGAPDFRLAAGSPAINAGINLFTSGVRTDFGGKTRPQTGAFEIGAYEFGTAPPRRQPSMPGGLRVR